MLTEYLSARSQIRKFLYQNSTQFLRLFNQVIRLSKNLYIFPEFKRHLKRSFLSETQIQWYYFSRSQIYILINIFYAINNNMCFLFNKIRKSLHIIGQSVQAPLYLNNNCKYLVLWYLNNVYWWQLHYIMDLHNSIRHYN